jgi:hypothetical protein
MSCESPEGGTLDMFDLNYVITQVCVYMNWKPLDCEGLFLDREDCFGLLYWYDFILPQLKRDIKAQKK